MRPLALALAGALAFAAAASAEDAATELSSRRAAVAALPADTPRQEVARQRYLVGAWAREHGLLDAAREEFRAALAADPSNEAAHLGLGDVRAGDEWIAMEEAMARKGLVLRDSRWILREEAAILDLPAQERARRKEEQAKVEKLLKAYAAADGAARKYATDALAGVDDRYKLDPLAWGLRSRSKDLRLFAAAELGRIGDRRALRPLLWRAVHDPDESVRLAAVSAAKAIGDPNLVVPLVGALASTNTRIRANAAQAIGEVGDVRGVRWLVYRLSAHGGSAERVYNSSIRQVSFIQDFDVEVAQTAFIADPVVGTIQEGLVLDVIVVATSQESEYVEREVVYAALRKLTGATDVPNQPGAWAKWYSAHGKDLEAASAR